MADPVVFFGPDAIEVRLPEGNINVAYGDDLVRSDMLPLVDIVYRAVKAGCKTFGDILNSSQMGTIAPSAVLDSQVEGGR